MQKILSALFICFLTIVLSAQESEITFQSNGLELNGTLSLPIEGEGPFPLVILVHGSGPNDRDQSLALNDPNSQCLYPGLFGNTIRNFRDISDHLSSEGIAVLRYDKVTFTHGAALAGTDILVSDFADDVESAIEFTLTQESIDPERIYLAGHSQGSSLIPIAAVNSGQVRGLISLAGLTSPVEEALINQLANLFIDCANDQASADFITADLTEQFNAVREGNFSEGQQIVINLPGQPAASNLGPASFWFSWLEIGDAVLSNYQNAGLRNLIIQGQDDFNVPFEDANAFEVLDNTEVNIYEGINHFLTSSTVPNVDEEILNDIVSWILADVSGINNLLSDEDLNLVYDASSLQLEFIDDDVNATIELFDISGRLLSRSVSNERSVNIVRPNTGAPLLLNVSTDQGRKAWVLPF